jgi:TatD DNase family protein
LKTLNYIDAHIHLADNGYAGKIDEVIRDAEQHHISQLLSNATDYQSSRETIELAKRFPNRVLAAVGVHPFTATQSTTLNLDKLSELIDENAKLIAAIGEVGLDGKYTKDERLKTLQREAPQFCLELAEDKQLPVVVHSRQATSETLSCLADYHLPGVLLHWYDGPLESLRLIKERKYFISVGPALLYSHRTADIARASDPNIILTETDGPVRYRALFGEELTKPSLVIAVTKKLAELRNADLDTVRSTTITNFQRFLSNRAHDINNQ